MAVQSPKGPHVAWPSWRYGPDGEAAIFTRAEDVPDGWYDHPKKHEPGYVAPADEEALAAREAALAVREAALKEKVVIPLTRDEMCAGLFQRHIPFDEDASDVTLYALVQASQAIEAAAEKAAQELLDEASQPKPKRKAASE
jgi:hypothetical protein